jgi:hypothetical protein
MWSWKTPVKASFLMKNPCRFPTKSCYLSIAILVEIAYPRTLKNSTKNHHFYKVFMPVKVKFADPLIRPFPG